MTTKTKRRYDVEFKKMIVQRHEEGASVQSLCNDFDLKEGTIYPWINQYSKKGTSGNASKELHEFSNDDYLQLQKEIREIKQENEILKKCITIFSKK